MAFKIAPFVILKGCPRPSGGGGGIFKIARIGKLLVFFIFTVFFTGTYNTNHIQICGVIRKNMTESSPV